LAAPESNVLLSKMGQAQFPVTQLSQKTLAGLFFALAMVGGGGGVRGQPTTGPKSFMTGRNLDPPLCDNIKDTLGQSIIV
jgi:hypothetical protein